MGKWVQVIFSRIDLKTNANTPWHAVCVFHQSTIQPFDESTPHQAAKPPFIKTRSVSIWTGNF